MIPILSGLAFVMGVMAWLFAREKAGKAKDRVEGAVAKVTLVEPGGLAGTALVAGEIWSFTSDAPLAAGDKARVAGKQGLQLKLSKQEK